MDDNTQVKEVNALGSSLKVGDITLISSHEDIDTLSKHMIWLLQQQEVLKYLSIFEQKKLKFNGDYYG